MATPSLLNNSSKKVRMFSTDDGVLTGKSVPRPRSRLATKIAFLLLAWYACSSIAIFFTKGLLSVEKRQLPDFRFALTITATNNAMAYLAAAALSPSDDRSSHESNVRRISFLIGTTTAGEIGLCNIALSVFSISFATILKGTAPFFVMVWGIAFGLFVPQAGLLASMTAIVLGVMLAVTGESTLSNFFSASAGRGLSAQLLSSILSGFRWVLTQVFLKGETGTNNKLQEILNIQPLRRGLSTVETIRLTTPFTCFPLLPFIVLVEGRGLVEWAMRATLNNVLAVAGTLVCVGLSVFCLLLAEYELVKITSSLTVSVAFVVKEVLVIFADRVIFSQQLDPLTWFGFGVVQVGIVGYALSKRTALCSKTSEDRRPEVSSLITETDVP